MQKPRTLILGSKISVQAYKNDGTLYRQWDNFFIHKIINNQILLSGTNVLVKEKNGIIWKYQKDVNWVLFNDRFYNCLYYFNNTYQWYCNIASPYFYENGILKFIDYDVDVKINSDKNIEVRDMEEFKQNKCTSSFQYSENLCLVVSNSLKKLLHIIKNKEDIFSADFINFYFHKKNKKHEIQ